MAALTRSNIAYDLSISPHRETLPYGGCDLTFVFSSELYKNKFLEKRRENEVQINNSLSKRFGFEVRLPVLADVKLYSTIEKRGFLIIKDGKESIWQKDLLLDGEMMTLRNSGE